MLSRLAYTPQGMNRLVRGRRGAPRAEFASVIDMHFENACHACLEFTHLARLAHPMLTAHISQVTVLCLQHIAAFRICYIRKSDAFLASEMGCIPGLHGHALYAMCYSSAKKGLHIRQ